VPVSARSGSSTAPAVVESGRKEAKPPAGFLSTSKTAQRDQTVTSLHVYEIGNGLIAYAGRFRGRW
jgi:hypothetical protein